ncbi:GtrA family protein [Metabacillus litoralis]|uniref:GtrA family protein n=1 Tax=Metabacillus litoralis TaxID=152268 RepID=A0A5C6W6G3_9BACI|nr:GtrA family protein [Metabacillus litoralis]TXC92984.1 GtrA family protein [Metabacillus litoralis]
MTINNLTFKFIKYSFVGIICTLIYFISMFLFVELFKKDPVISATTSFIIMTVFSFLLNKKYTFGGVYSHQQLLRFSIVAGIGFTLNLIIMYGVVHLLSLHYIVGEITTLLIIPIVNFTLNNIWTFK